MDRTHKQTSVPSPMPVHPLFWQLHWTTIVAHACTRFMKAIQNYTALLATCGSILWKTGGVSRAGFGQERMRHIVNLQ